MKLGREPGKAGILFVYSHWYVIRLVIRRYKSGYIQNTSLKSKMLRIKFF